MYSYLLQYKFMRKAQGMCIKFKIDGAQSFSRMCMCIEFIIQVLKQKNARVCFPVGMVHSVNVYAAILSEIIR